MAVKGATSSHGGKRKRVTREAQYKRSKAAESARRKLSTSNDGASSSTTPTSSSKGKGRAKEVEENPHPFRYKSFNDRLANVHINISNSLGRSGTGALSGLEGHGILPVAGASSSRMQLDGKVSPVEEEDDNSDDDDDASSALHAKTSFGVALNSWKELNLSLPFTLVLQQIQPLSHSLPMLLHYQEKIAMLLGEGLSATHRDSYLGYEPLLDLIPRLANDLGSAFLPCFPDLLAATLRITMISKLNTDGEEYTAAMLVERAFESAAATLRCVAPFVLREQKSTESEVEDWLQRTWQIIRPYLGWKGDGPRSFEADKGDVTSAEDLDFQEDFQNKDQSRHNSKHGKIPPHTRRFSSEALAHLVRRAKGEQLSRVAAVMMQDLQGELSNESKDARVFCSGIAGVWLEVAKSVDHRLHSAATDKLTALLLPLPENSWDAEGCQARTLVGCDIITALVHHGQSLHLVPLFEWLAGIVRSRLTESSLRQENGLQQLSESVKWLTSYVGTRKGKRVEDSIKPSLFDVLLVVAGVCEKEATRGNDEARSSMLQLLALSLPIGRIQDLIGPGRRLIDSLASVQSDGSISAAFVALASSLGQPDFEFAGFRQIVLPSVMTCSAMILQGDTPTYNKGVVLSLLATLQKQGQFDHMASAPPSSTSTSWIKALFSEVLAQLQVYVDRVKRKDFSADEMVLASLALAPLSHEKAEALVGLLCECMAAIIKDGQSEDYEATPLNKAAMLGAILEALSQLILKGKKSVAEAAHRQLSAMSEVKNLSLVFAWHRQVVCSYAGLVSVLRHQGCVLPIAPLDELIVSLQSAMGSSDEPLRLAAARLLALSHQQHHQDSKLHAILNGVVEIEETALTVETVRERNVRMRALAREVVKLKQSFKEHSPMLDTCAGVAVTYLVSVFKLNFKPLWEESRKALVDIGVVYGQLVWEVAFKELKTAQPVSMLPSSWSTNEEQEQVSDTRVDDNESVDKQFIDPQLSQRRMIVTRAYRSQASRAILDSAIEAQRPGGRLDLINYQGLILKLFASITIVAERNNSPLMQHFFATIVSRRDELTEAEDAEEANRETVAKSGSDFRLTMPQRRAQLCAYLETFAQFSNPKALYRSQDLHEYLYRLCSQGDNKVQCLALDVILQWKDPAHITYQAVLKKLIDQSQFREELTSLNLAPDGETIQVGHRKRLLPLLIRLFFGIMVSKRGRASQGSGQVGRKNAILTALAALPCEELETLVDVMLEPFKDQAGNAFTRTKFVFSTEPPSASSGQQLGFLAMLGDVIKHLGLQIIPLWDRLVEVLLNLTYHASKRAEKGQGRVTLLDRSIRQGGLRRLDDLFKQPTDAFDWSSYMDALFEHLVSPRLPLLRSESIQSPSALLDLIHTWSNSSATVLYLVNCDKTLLEHVSACLQMPTVKASVVDRVLDVVDAILAYADSADKDSTFAPRIEADILRPHTSILLAGITPLVQRCNRLSPVEAKAMKRDDLVRRLLRILSKLAAYVVSEEDAVAVLDALSPLLRKNNAIIAEKSKVDLLLVFEQLLGLIPAMKDASSPVFESHYQLFSGLFSRLRSRNARLALSNAFAKLASVDPNLSELIDFMRDLNSFDVKRMEEYDFDRRLKVYDLINEEGPGGRSMTSREWLPLLHNFLFNLQDADELAIRSNAGTSIRRFIDVVQKEQDNTDLASLFKTVVYPGFRRSLRSKSDLVQREVVSLLGYAVTELGPSFDFLSEMTPLLVGGDEEASFFNNIFHIQLHRRIRALNRLGQEAANQSFSSRLIVEIFLPLVDQFLNTDTHHGEANLIQAAVETLGKLSMQLKWGPYNVLLWKFLSIGKKVKVGDKEREKEKSDKVCVRAAMSILDNFHFQMDEAAEIDGTEEDHESEGEGEAGAQEVAEAGQVEAAEESKKVLDAVLNRLLPKLMDFLDMKDDLEDTLRLPIAVGVARVMLKLPHLQKRQQITRLLTTLANVFKSKAQDTRDLARFTLGRVAISLGPDYFPAIVKELRRALVRGPQRAVLAYTLHNIIVQCMSSDVTPLVKIEYGTSDVVDVVMEDMFGLTAEDRESIENRTTYKEVKSVKSPDTLEQVAKIVSTGQVAALLGPLRDLMHQTEAVKAVKNMDDYLRRVAAGLFVNEHVSNGDFLLLCHSLFTNNADFLQSNKRDVRKKPSRVSAVLRKRSELEDGVVRDYYTRNAYKFVTFGLDLLINALRKSRFDFSDAECLAKLDPLVHAVGNCLYASQSAVLISGLKALALLVKCPVPSVQSSLPLIVKQTLQIVDKEGANAQSDVLMAALKLLTVVIRDLPTSTLQDRQVAQLCRLININLEEDAEMQGVLFGLLRAIVGRKFVVAEVYDVMDKVASMMITNQSQSIRDVSRSTYLSFLLEYPQGKQRFANQMRFLAKNISYVFESGRLSLFEMLRIIFIKVDEVTLRDHLNLFFVSLVMCLGNDESSRCKEKATKLIVQILDLSRREEREKLVDLVHLWSSGEKRDLMRISMMVYGLFTDAESLKEVITWRSKAISHARLVLASSAEDLREREMNEDEDEEEGDRFDWQLPFHALQVVTKLYSSKVEEVDSDAVLWDGVRELLLYPHAWVRSAACRMIGQRLSQTEVQPPKRLESAFLSLPNLLSLTRKSSLMLKSEHLDDSLALQLVKNLVFIGKSFALAPVLVGVNGKVDEIDDKSDSEGEQEDEEESHDWSLENPLRWMFAKLSHQLRQCKLTNASMEKVNLLQPTSLLKWIAAMVHHLPVEQSRLFLTHIISPLYRLLEAEAHLARNNDGISQLQALASEVQDLIQQKLGTSAYSTTYASIKQKMAEKRKKRKNDALMMAIEQPERAMQRKATINQRKHESRKRKTQAYASNKERIRPTKRDR